MNYLYELKEDASRCNVAINIKDCTLKLKAIDMIKERYNKILAIKSLDNIEDKVKAFLTVEDNIYYIDFLEKELSDREKVRILNAVRRVKKKNDFLISDSIYKIKDDNFRLEAVMQCCDFKEAESFIECQKLVYILNGNFKRFKSIHDKIAVAINSDDDDLKVDIFRKINQRYLKLNIINSMLDDSKKIQLLKEMKLNRDEIKWYRTTEENISFLIKNIKTFMELENITNVDYKANIIEELYKKNNEVVKNIDFKILEEKYIQLLGTEKINLISCYEDIQKKILELDDNQLVVFNRCIEEDGNQGENDAWTIYADEILDNILDKQYKELISEITKEKNLTKEDFKKLRMILQNKNIYNIKNMNQVKNFDTIMKEKMESVMHDENKPLEMKKNAVLQKIFGHDLFYAKKIISKYGESINEINNEDIKSYFRALTLIINTTDENKLKEIFYICEGIKIDKGTIELKIRDEYRKLLNEDLYFPTSKDLVGENIYEAGVNFKIIITSVAAYVRATMCENYKEDWNRPTIQSQHMCTSYIRNDMIGMAPVHDICYGFNNMEENSLMLAGNIDLASYTETIVSETYRKERFYAPDDLINNTKRHNELCYRRIQKGEKKQPDYIIVFRREGTIKYMEKAKKASEDFGNLPIVIIDIDKCLENEKIQVEQMYKEYERTHDNALLKQIQQKIKNNRETDPNFGDEFDEIIKKNDNYSKQDIDNDKEKNEIKTVQKQHLIVNVKQKESEMQNLCKKIEEVIEDDER